MPHIVGMVIIGSSDELRLLILSGSTVLRTELDLQCVVGSYGGLACESAAYVTGVAAGGEATGAVCSVLCCGKSRDNPDLKLLFNQELSTGPILMGA